MNRYLILIHGDDEAFYSLPPEEMQQILDSMDGFEQKIQREGRLLSTHRLMPARQGKLVRLRGGAPAITDGPYTETKEHLGGYYLLEAPDEGKVLEWLRLLPPVMDVTFEVRQVADPERSVT